MPGTEGRKADSPNPDGGVPGAVSRSKRRTNARRTSEVMHALRRVTGARPQLDPITTRRLAKGQVAWTEVPAVRTAALDGARAAIDRQDLAGAATLTKLLRTGAPDAETGRLAGIVALLTGDPEAAEEHFYQASKGTGSVARRHTNARRAVEELQQLLDLRARVLEVEGPEDLTDLRDIAASASITHRKAADAALGRYLVACLTRGIDGPLGQLLDEFADAGRLTALKARPNLLDVAVENAEYLATDADHAGALHLLQTTFEHYGVVTERYLLALGTSLSALSRYGAARRAFRIASAGVGSARAAQVAWIIHDDESAHALARRAIRHDMPRSSVRTVLARTENPITPPEAEATQGGMGHVAFYVDRGENFGDIVLPDAVRDAISEPAGRSEWVPFHAHQVFDDEFVRIANAQRALVVGGGGLFLPDTSPNGNSGWQWNVPPASLDAVRVPLFAFAVGFNLFLGQQFKGDLFRRSLIAFTSKAEFLGLRNTGSMERVRAMLPDELHDKVRFVPCPTTVLEHIRPDLPAARTGSGTVLLNAAFDRSERRFGGGYAQFLEHIVELVEKASRGGAEVRIAAHTRGDLRLAKDLEAAHDLSLPVDELHNMDQPDALAVYRQASLVIGMRGHSTMIPFGLGTPVLSIVSHPKMRYFLEDVDRTDWGFDVSDPDLGARLAERTLDVLAREEDYRADVAERQLILLPHVRAAAEDVAKV
ncbi:polysaccharide pyruvyl transferase family protein [Promicromonospora iranensis]|uniref:Polysaccharide pyruvyl transferase WcaK-like protein n=1 Tax=Promicromonospora iranensis TaxID=1105144 RepID=A0ABU2CRW4_9MICO|nr:polysaccharide pyruvyl transferase family protein [Promicromonospora iranensis]MDR7384082.1 polysaccharide pyruvyl transferase WcaK-like protein [Promicromonospora iranensis]